MSRAFLNLFIVAVSFLFFVACNNKDDVEKTGTDAFRRDMLNNIGNNIILPNYLDLQTKVDLMNEAINNFLSEPNQTNLTTAREAYTEAYKAWQFASVFEFGPADVQLLRGSLNTFPTNTDQINSNVASGQYNLSTADNFKAKGFPAIDYLLYGVGSEDIDIIAHYTTIEGSENRKEYLSAISEDIKDNVDKVYNEWIPSGGNYIEEFINASGSDAGSSLSLLVNQLNYDYELIKNPKIGIPLGKRTLGEKLPANVEAYYSGISSELALLNVKAIEDIYLGRSKNGNNGTGLDDYLVHLNTQYNGGLLDDAIKAQFEKVKSAVEQLPDPLADAILENPEVVENAYSEIQKMVVLMKTDMPSAMSVQIDYVDNDGD